MTTYWEFYHTTSNPTGMVGLVGGDITGSLIQGNLNELFAHVDAPQSGISTADVQYRKLHVKNTSSSTLSGVRIWLDSLEHSDQITMGLQSVSFTGNSTLIASPTTAPDSVVFSQPINYTGGLDAGVFAPAYTTGLWIKQSLQGIHEPDLYSSFRVNVGGIEL